MEKNASVYYYFTVPVFYITVVDWPVGDRILQKFLAIKYFFFLKMCTEMKASKEKTKSMQCVTKFRAYSKINTLVICNTTTFKLMPKKQREAT